MTLYHYEFLESADEEFRARSRKLRRLFVEKLFYLHRNPFKSYPWLGVRQGARHPGECRFHLGDYRVFYRVDGTIIVFTRVVERPVACPKRPPMTP